VEYLGVMGRWRVRRRAWGGDIVQDRRERPFG